jgi:hypothetical protein
MDDGYLFVHSAHSLAPKLKQILHDGKTARSLKKRLTDAASYGCPGFSGSLRPPLSNEVFPTGETLNAPKVSSEAMLTNSEGLFTDAIVSNDCICVSFSEPPKLSHKSVLLPGVVVLPPTLTDKDKQIRRPRLNRGVGSIANMGVANGQSFQSGHGSMNISSYERDLALRTGRGNEMNQAGTRSWGSLEPTQKRRFQAENPFESRGNSGAPPPPPSLQTPWHHQQHFQYQQQGQHYNVAPGFQPQQQPQHAHVGYNNLQQLHTHQQPLAQGYFQQPMLQRNGIHFAPRGNPHRPQIGIPPGSKPSFDFRSHNQTAGPRPPSLQQPPQPSGTVNSSLMSSLKAQLKSTLKQNRDKR